MELKSRTMCVSYPHRSLLRRSLEQVRCSLRMRSLMAGIRWAGRALIAAKQLHRKQPFDMIMSRSPSDLSHLPALRLSKETGIPWVANINDPPSDCWPEPYDSAEKGLFHYTTKRLLGNVFKNASAVTFPCERLRDHVLKVYGMPHRTEIIPHIGLKGYEPECEPSNSVFRLFHAGNMSAERDPSVLFKALRGLLDVEKPTPQVELEIMGVEGVHLKRLVKEHGLQRHVRISGGSRYLETLDRMSASSVLVVVEAPCSEGIFLPGKVADYVSTRRPILSVSPATGTMKDMVHRYGGGIVVDGGSVEDTLRGLRELYGAWSGGQLDRYVSGELRSALSPSSAMAKYDALLAELIV